MVQENQEKKPEEQLKEPRICPAFKTPCIEERCIFYVKIQQRMAGTAVGRTMGICSVPALVLLISSKVQAPQKIDLSTLKLP